MLCQDCYFAGKREEEAKISGFVAQVVHTLRPSPTGIQLLAHFIDRCSVCDSLILVDTSMWELKKPAVTLEKEVEDETPPAQAS